MEQIRADLEAFLGEKVGRLESIPEGHSGFTYFVDAGGREYVMRLPPPGARIAGPADVVRQGRIMASLHAAGLPVPSILAMSEEPTIDGRPFILMEKVDGVRVEVASGRWPHEDLARSAVGVLKRLHELPLKQTGIGGEEPMTLSGEIARWTWLLERSPQELVGRAPVLAESLERRQPAPRPPTLVHADYHYGNLLFGDGRVVAVLDWEIAEIGQPLIDLGCMAIVAKQRKYRDAATPGGNLELADGAVAKMYGADPAEFGWFLAFSCYKYAAIYGYNLNLHRRGKRPDPMYETMTTNIEGLIEEGIQLLS